MNTLDIILGILLLIGLVRGFFRGFLVELAGIIALVAGIYAAIYFSDGTLAFLRSFLDWEPQYLKLLAFGLTFLVVVIVISILARMLTKVMDMVALGIVNKLLGGIFGILKVAFVTSVFFMFLNQSVAIGVGKETKEKSILYPTIEMIAPLLLPTVLERLEEDEIFNWEGTEEEDVPQ